MIDEKALPLGGVGHLERVGRHQRVEEGVVLLRSRAFLRAQNATKTLRLLTPRSSVRRNLDQDVRLGNVEGVVGNLQTDAGSYPRFSSCDITCIFVAELTLETNIVLTRGLC